MEGENLITVKCFEIIYTIRKEINGETFKDVKSINKVLDGKLRKILLDRLTEYSGNAKTAFSDLEKKPIWLNQEKVFAPKEQP